MALNSEEILKMVLWSQRDAVLQKQREEIDELQGQLLWSMKCLKSKVQDFLSQFCAGLGVGNLRLHRRTTTGCRILTLT